MKKGKRAPATETGLRSRAEERLQEKPRSSEAVGTTAQETQRLLHELQVHQIELELQNEELRRAQVELEAGLERYTELYDFAPIGYLTLGRDGTIRKVNLTGARLLRLERSRLVGGRFGLFVAEDSRAVFSAFLKKLFKSRANEACDVALHADNSESCSVHIEAAASEDGQECRAVLLDITERQRAEEALRLSEERFRVALQYSPITVGTLDRELRYTWIYNARHGFVPETVVGKRPDELIAPKDAAELMALLRHVLETGKAERREVSGRTKGTRWDYQVSVEPTRDQQGKIAGLTLAMIDVTERKQAEDALREADRRKDDFLAVLSHELRNPLAPIMNSLFILDRAVPGGDQARRAHAVLDRQIAQLARLVDDLLDVTRITRNKITLQRQRLELNGLVRTTMDDHRSLFERSEISLELTPASAPIYVNADWNRLAQVIGNLLQNAAKFTAPKGATRVSVTADVTERRAVVRIVDSGVGMAPRMLSRLFEPFSQADNTLDRSKGGLGLGLALVKGLVDLHSGEISAYSEGLGRGTEVVVRLPLDLTEAEKLPAARPGVERNPRRVLIIEDNVDAADSLSEALAFGEHEVATAYNGPEGLTKAREFRPDVVLCDIGLPGMDGYEVARAFRADDDLNGIFLVALSGYALPEDLQRASEAGFERHLAKPPSIEKLEELLAQAPRRTIDTPTAGSRSRC
jgi:PAS domain S-box-containing protein